MDRFLLFNKNFMDLKIPALIDTVKIIGAQGIDMAVRPGYVINPENVRRALPIAARAIREAGLEIPLISTPTDFVDPSSKFAEDLWAACHDSGVENIKIGYWNFDNRP